MQANQLALFKIPIISRKLDDRLLVPKPLEDFMPDAIPGKHILYPTGGWHYFCKEAPKGSIYTQPIWPYLTNTNQYKTQLTSIYFSDGTNYMMASICTKKWPYGIPKMMHVMVALAYIWNKDPDKYYQVSHLGDDKCNYLPDNLEWNDASGNHTGKKQKRLSSKQQDYEFARYRKFIL